MVTITNKGVETAARMIANVSPAAAFTYMATGSGSGSESVTDTQLSTENTLSGSARTAATCSFISPGTVQWTNLFSFSGDVIIREVGIFNASSAGDMFLRLLLSANKNYSDGESAQITITTTTSSA